MAKVTIEIDAENCPEEMFETDSYRKALVGEIRRKLFDPEVPSNILSQHRKNIEKWWEGNINITETYYGLDIVLEDVCEIVVGDEVRFFSFNKEPLEGVEETAIAKTDICEQTLKYVLRKTWSKIRNHRNNGYKLAWSDQDNVYKIRLMTPQAYDSIKCPAFDSVWHLVGEDTHENRTKDCI